jgi:radical SAM superfamily enzyme YgiQ (UPF0313 family)
MRRLSFGLETGSQALNDAMDKGTVLERTSQFIHDAHAAGISVRTTAMLGYPGETAADIRATVDFIKRHEGKIDRILLSRFKAIPGTRFHRSYEREPHRYDGLEGFRWHPREGRADYRYRPAAAPAYRRASVDLVRAIHRINRRPLRDDARVFDGLM